MAMKGHRFKRVKALLHQPCAHLFIAKAKPGMGMTFTQFLPAMRRQIDNRDPPARPTNTRRFGQREGRIRSEMQHLMQQNCVKTGRGKGQGGEIALHQFPTGGGQMLQPRPGKAQHLRAAIKANNMHRIRRKSFGAAASTCANIKQRAKRLFPKRPAQGCFDITRWRQHIA